MIKTTNIALLLVVIVLLAACSQTPEAETVPLSEQAQRGQRLFQIYCGSCHSTVGNRIVVGPALEGIATRAGERIEGVSAADYIYESIVNPDAYIVDGFKNGSMQQNFGTQLTSEEVNALVEYLLTLK